MKGLRRWWSGPPNPDVDRRTLLGLAWAALLVLVYIASPLHIGDDEDLTAHASAKIGATGLELGAGAAVVGRSRFVGPPVPPQACPALPAHPTPACTGLPNGTILSNLPVDGDAVYTVSTNNAIIDSVHVAGSLLIRADNVTVKNSLVDGSITNEGCAPTEDCQFTVMDTTIGPTDEAAALMTGGCLAYPAIRAKQFTAIRVEVRNHDNGFQNSWYPSEPAHVEDSFAKICGQPPEVRPPDGSHADGFQAYCPPNGATPNPCGEVTLIHNTFEIDTDYTTAAVFAGDSIANGYPTAFTLRDSLLIGGVFTIFVGWQGGGPNYVIDNNEVVDATASTPGFKEWGLGAATTNGTCAHIDWTDNTIVAIDSSYVTTSTLDDLPCPS